MNEAVLDSPEGVASADRPVLSRRFSIALTVLLGGFAGLGPLAIDMYLPSFSAIAKDFAASGAQVERTLTAYLFGLALGQLLYGPAADRFGRKRPLYVGLALFVIASAGCASARGIGSLTLLRTIEAIGGCAEMVIARAVVRDLFDDRTGIRVFSSLMLIMGVAPILAPAVGGAIVTHLGWRAVFWILVAAGSICFCGALFLLPESLPPERRHPHTLGSTLHVYRRLLSHRIFIVHSLTIGVAMAALFAYVGGSPALYIGKFGIPAGHFWWFFGANAACLIGMSQVNGYLAHRVDPRKVLRVALLVGSIASVALLAFVFTGFGGLWAITPCLMVFLGTFGFIFPTTTILAMSAHGKNAGNASALLGCFQFLISAIGGIVATTLPFPPVRSMAVTIAGCMVLVAIIRTAGKLASASSSHGL